MAEIAGVPPWNDRKLADLLARFRKITVVGLSNDPLRPSYGVTRYLIDHGYEITGVRPGGGKILDRPCYETLQEVPGPLEIVDVFRRSESIPSLIEELIPLRPQVIWLQEGVTHPEAEERARHAGIEVISDRCILKEHLRLLGGS